MSDPVRVGAVTYLNTKPLVYELEHIAPHSRIVYDVPSRLARQLQAGQLDVALIPCSEYLKCPDYTIVSDACIACRGPVMSVKLYCRVPPGRIATLALDEGSRTSVALVRILLRERWGVTPRLEVLPLGAGLADTRADAVLLIGDRAIRGGDDRTVEIWDLGDQWCRWTELPFVFALWTARANTICKGSTGPWPPLGTPAWPTWGRSPRRRPGTWGWIWPLASAICVTSCTSSLARASGWGWSCFTDMRHNLGWCRPVGN